jgi:hypothetical protein
MDVPVDVNGPYVREDADRDHLPDAVDLVVTSIEIESDGDVGKDHTQTLTVDVDDDDTQRAYDASVRPGCASDAVCVDAQVQGEAVVDERIGVPAGTGVNVAENGTLVVRGVGGVSAPLDPQTHEAPLQSVSTGAGGALLGCAGWSGVVAPSVAFEGVLGTQHGGGSVAEPTSVRDARCATGALYVPVGTIVLP